ncbi:MAG: acylphosphatase [Breznakibacter sp.]
MKRIHMILEGKVQGVGFRCFVQKQASAMGVNGYVRNLSNGSVEIEAEATSSNLLQFIDLCKKGPSMARIEMVHQSELPSWGYQSFQIK